MADDPLSFAAIGRRLGAGARLIAGFGLAGLLIGALLWLLLPKVYVSQATLLPSGGEEPGLAPRDLVGLAGSLGLNLPSVAIPESHLYPAILRSERVVRSVLEAPLDPDRPKDDRLLDRLTDDPADDAQREKAIDRVRHEVLRVALDEETGVVRVTVRLDDAHRARRVAGLFLDGLAEYLRTERNAKSRENLVFVEQRRDEAETSLEDAENELRAFRATNRRIDNSPELALEEARLRRRVAAQEEIYLELIRQAEAARIETRKNATVLEVLDPPTLRTRPFAPRLMLLAPGGLLVGLFLGAALAMFVDRPGRD